MQISPVSSLKQHDGANPHVSSSQWLQKVKSISAFIWGLTCFLPYPALPVGNSTGIQIGNVVGVFLAIVLVSKLPKRNAAVWLMLLLPILLSTLLISFLGGDFIYLTISTSVILAWAFFSFSIIVTGFFLPHSANFLYMGISLAILLHTGVGIYQIYSFEQNIFPFYSLYINPSFASFTEGYAEAVAFYIKRPFGLFPEPSAMTASIGPWVLLFLAYLLGLVAKNEHTRLTTFTRFLMLLAAIGGTWLIFSSKSGFVFFMSLSILLILATFALTRSRSLLQAYVAFIGLATLSGIIAWLAYAVLGDRVSANLDIGSSWALRYQSIRGGLSLMRVHDWYTWFVGVGAGQNASLIQNNLGFDAVWSIFFTYFIENGVFGVLAWLGTLTIILFAILRSISKAVGFILLGTWLVCVVLVTSYPSLLPVWSFLGLLLNWDLLTSNRQTKIGDEL